MTELNPSLPSELIDTVDIGLGHTAVVQYVLLPPPDPPCSGSEWKVENDYPLVVVTLRLPQEYGVLHPEIRDDSVDVFDGSLTMHWGFASTDARERYKEKRFATDSVEKSMAEARAYVALNVAELRSVLAKRALRLAQREHTIAIAMRSSTLRMSSSSQ